MPPTLSLALACYVLVRLARVCLDDLEHGLTRALAALAALVAVVSIGTIAAQEGGALVQALEPWQVALERVQGLVLGAS
jgi:hypothetical protein